MRGDKITIKLVKHKFAIFFQNWKKLFKKGTGGWRIDTHDIHILCRHVKNEQPIIHYILMKK